MDHCLFGFDRYLDRSFADLAFGHESGRELSAGLNGLCQEPGAQSTGWYVVHIEYIQAAKLCFYNFIGMRDRLGLSLVAIVGFAALSSILVALFGLRAGLQRTFEVPVDTRVAVVLGGSGAQENTSVITSDTVIALRNLPVIASDIAGSLVSAELVDNFVEVPSRDERMPGSVVLGRGVESIAFVLRPNFRVQAGRLFVPGKLEGIAGRMVATKHGLSIGDHVHIGDSQVRIVGVFEDGGSALENEVWLDIRVFADLSSFGGPAGLNHFSSIWVRLANQYTPDDLNRVLQASPAFERAVQALKAMPLAEIRELQSGDLRKRVFIALIAVGVAIGSGAFFGSLNMLASSVLVRTKEIATLRSLGFGVFPLVATVITEALTVCLIGSGAGALLAYLALNGLTVTTFNVGSNSQVVIPFLSDAGAVSSALVVSTVLCLVSSIVPCLKLLRLQIVAGLREG